MISIRRAALDDLDFLVEIDWMEDGYTQDPSLPPPTSEEIAAHRAKIAAFVCEPDEAGWLAVDDQTGQRAGMILARYRDRLHEAPTEANLFLFRFLDASVFPPDGRFCEVFNLWVHPAYRRQGLATRLKLAIEEEARRRGMQMIYTHTEERNLHVIELNEKLGYYEVRRGPLGDEVTRVSLVKWL